MNNQFSTEETTWGMICHFSAFVFFLIPLGNIIGPLVVWILRKKQFPFVMDQGKESLNFQLSMTLYALVSSLLISVMIGVVLLVIIGIITIVFTIVAGIKAKDGIYYRYPFTLNIIK